MPKKSAKKSIKQRQEQTQNISIKIGELPKKKPRRRPRKGPSAPGREAPLRQLPPVVYQTLPQLVSYNAPQTTITAPPKPATSIVAPVKAKTTILEDVGMVGTEGPVEILDVPTKRETLKELITPVDIPRRQVDPVQSGPFDIPRRQVNPVEEGPFDIPRMQVDPVEQPTISGLFKEQKATTIVEPPMQQFPITQMEGPMKKTREPQMESGVESLTSMIAEVIRETSPVKKAKKPRRSKAEIEEARLEKERAKSVSIAQPVSMFEVYPSEKYVAGTPRSQTVKGRKKAEGTIIPSQADVNRFFAPKMQPFVSEKADFFETLSSGRKTPPTRNTSPKPGLITREGPIIRKPRSKATEVL
jgi:hypothetical protein